MKFIQLGNIEQCKRNGLELVGCVYEFGKVIGFNMNKSVRAFHRSTFPYGANQTWHSHPEHRTSFYLELRM